MIPFPNFFSDKPLIFLDSTKSGWAKPLISLDSAKSAEVAEVIESIRFGKGGEFTWMVWRPSSRLPHHRGMTDDFTISGLLEN
jgi:hypothetical protein